MVNECIITCLYQDADPKTRCAEIANHLYFMFSFMLLYLQVVIFL